MRLFHWTLAAVLLVPVAVKAGVVLTVEAPGVESSSVSGVTTENFNGFSTGVSTNLSILGGAGTLSALSPGFDIYAADQYGGAGGTGKFLVVGGQVGSNFATSATLTLTTPATYFGMWLSALDGNNTISLYYLGGLVASYNASQLSSAIGSNSLYLGNPSGTYAGQDTGEKFAYLNFTGTGGTEFDKIVFNNGTTSTGEEMDNFSILPASAVPLPSGAGIGLIGLALAGGVLTMRRGAGAKAC